MASRKTELKKRKSRRTSFSQGFLQNSQAKEIDGREWFERLVALAGAFARAERVSVGPRAGRMRTLRTYLIERPTKSWTP